MNRRGSGVSFCFISALLFSIRYIRTEDASIFSTDLLIVASSISLVVGVMYLIVAEKKNN